MFITRVFLNSKYWQRFDLLSTAFFALTKRKSSLGLTSVYFRAVNADDESRIKLNTYASGKRCCEVMGPAFISEERHHMCQISDREVESIYKAHYNFPLGVLMTFYKIHLYCLVLQRKSQQTGHAAR